MYAFKLAFLAQAYFKVVVKSANNTEVIVFLVNRVLPYLMILISSWLVLAQMLLEILR